MALNFPGPYEARIFYTTVVSSVVLTHSLRLSFVVDPPEPEPGELWSNIFMLKRGGTNVELDTTIDALIVLLKALYHSSSEFEYAELWKYEDQSFDASFVSAYGLSVVGTSGTATVSAGQNIYSFRTLEGGSMRVNLMESIIPAGGVKGYADCSGAEQALINHFQDATVPWVGRDTSYPFVFTRAFPGQSEALFKKRYR